MADPASGETVIFEIRVKDTGIGMTPEFAEKVFEPFERERTSTVSGIQGTGLGMAITKRIVDGMGGNIRVETAQGKGTEFIVRLPLRIQDSPGQEEPDCLKNARNDALPCAAGDKKIDFTGMRILLAEDVPVNREIALAILTQMGFEVDTAHNGREAVEMAEASPRGFYQLILMDIQMPEMDGYEAARRIRAMEQPYPGDIPIVAMTANAFTEDVEAAVKCGMNAHVAKPIDVARLKETLESVLA